MAILRHMATGSGGINETYIAPAGRHQQLVSVSLHLSAAPTASENLTITLDSEAGAEYDTVLYKVDPASTSMTDLFWRPDDPTYLWPGDAVDVAWANSNNRTWGMVVTVRGA